MNLWIKVVYGGLACLLVSVPTADAGNCLRPSQAYSYQQSYATTYAAPAYVAQQSYYSQVVPYAVPYVVLPDTFYRVDSATAYARIAEAAAESAANKNSQQLLAMFQDFLRQQQAIQQQGQRVPAGPEKLDLPPVPQPPSDKDHPHPKQEVPKAPDPNLSLTDKVQKFVTASCIGCHNPNNPERLDLRDVTKLVKKQAMDMYHRISASDDYDGVMPPPDKKKARPTTIADVNNFHAFVDVAPDKEPVIVPGKKKQAAPEEKKAPEKIG